MMCFKTILREQFAATLRCREIALPRQRGASLIMVMMILIIVSLIGIAGIQISILSERSSRNDRDQQLAWQSAEAALLDAEIDITTSTTRSFVLSPQPDMTKFVLGCGTSGNSIGLCALPITGKPAWSTVDFTITGSSAPTTQYGRFTGRVFDAGGPGVQPALPPRYIIEPVEDKGVSDSNGPVKYAYRVTAMGFGPRSDIQAVVQMIFRP